MQVHDLDWWRLSRDDQHEEDEKKERDFVSIFLSLSLLYIHYFK